MNKNCCSFEILKIEYTQVCSKLQYLDDQANKYVSYILAFVGVLAAFLGLLVKDGEDTDFNVISLIISAGTLITGLFLIMMLHHTVQCFRVGGYVKHLEEEINKYLGYELLKWESNIACRYVHKDISTILIYVIMGIAFFALLTVAGWLAVSVIFHVWPAITVIILVIGILELFASCIYMNKALTIHEKTSAFFLNQYESTDHDQVSSEEECMDSSK